MITQEDSLNFYRLLQTELEKVTTKIKLDKEELLALKKPIAKEDATFTNRIMTCILYIGNKYRRYTDDEINDYYSSYGNAKYEYDRIMDILFYINCIQGIDYLLSKKALCSMLGINIGIYNDFLNSASESARVFIEFEEYMISIRQEGAETNTRNVLGVESTLRTKQESGGYGVKKVDDTLIEEGVKKFCAIDASPEEIKRRLQQFTQGKLIDTK